MRKSLLTLVVFATALSAFAQTWNTTPLWSKDLTPVNDASQLSNTRTAVTADGIVYTTGTFNQAFTFGSSTVANDDEMTSAYIAKYSAEGVAQCAVSLYGAAVIKDMVTDGDGNVYVVGNFAEEVVVNSADATSKTIQGMADTMEKTSVFVAKYDADLKLMAVRAIVPQDCEELQDDEMYPFLKVIGAEVNRVQVDGDKVYVSLLWTGDIVVDEMAWKGHYASIYDMPIDVASAGIFSLKKADLTGASSVAVLGVKENAMEQTQEVESVNFTVVNGVVYAGFVGTGTQRLSTANGTEDLTMEMDDEGNREHAFILVKIGDTTTSKVYHTAKHDKLFQSYAVAKMLVEGENLYVGGTFYDQLGFDTSKTATGASDMFVASVRHSDFSVNWTAISGYDEGDATANEEVMKTMVVNKGKVFMAGVARVMSGHATLNALTYNISGSGAISAGDNVEYAAIFDNGAGKTATIVNDGAKTTVTMYGSDEVAGITTILDAQQRATRVYNLNGQHVADDITVLSRGVYIVNGKKVVVR